MSCERNVKQLNERFLEEKEKLFKRLGKRYNFYSILMIKSWLYSLICNTCIAAAPNKPQVKNASEDAAIQEFPLLKNSLQPLLDKFLDKEPCGAKQSILAQRTKLVIIGINV